MSVENPDVAQNNDNFVKPMNGGLNGISNGHSVSGSSSKHSSSSSSGHKSSSKDKHRDKDRDKSSSSKSSSSSSRDKDKDRDKNKEKSRHSSSSHSSSSKDKDKEKSSSGSSSHKSSNRDKDRERDKDRDRHRDKDRDKERDKHRDNKDRGDGDKKDKDRDKHKDKPRDKDGTNTTTTTTTTNSSSSSSRDKERDREKSSRDGERSKDKSSSSSSHRDKDKSSSSRDKDRDKDRKSSSSKDKHSSSSSSKSRDKDKYKDKYSSSRDRPKDKENSDENNTDAELKEQISALNNIDVGMDNGVPYIKDEHNNMHGIIKREEETCFDYNGPIKTDSDEHLVRPKPEFLNSSQASSCDYSMSQFRDDEAQFVIKEEAAEENSVLGDENNVSNEDDEEDIPLTKRKAAIIDDDDDEEDMPLLARKKLKQEDESKKLKLKVELEVEEDDEEDLPLSARTKKEKKAKKKKAISEDEDDDYDDVKPKKKKMKKEKREKLVTLQVSKTSIKSESPQKPGGRKVKKEEPAQDVWKWWEEEKRDDGVKWNFLQHKGPVFAPPYEPLPSNVKFYYDGQVMKLSQDTEEIACFYAKMLEHEYTSKKQFNDNFFKDWRKTMTSKEKEKITNLHKCNFQEMCDYFKAVSEKNKSRSKEEKERIKAENEKLIQEYGFCTIDGHREKIGNFKIEPPGLFRGRGEHPKMGMIKRRIMPEDVSLNCSKDSVKPVPPPGHRWKEVRHDNQVTWLASWQENVQGQVKYIMLNPSSKLKGEKDWQKYETARRLHKTIDKIRNTYRDEWKSKEMRIRQRAVALYFIDKLALRAGNEKDEDQADTVGCCSLRVEHITLHKELDGKEHVVVFDFLGKDSIRYYNEVEVEKRVFKNLELFKENKKDGDDLFDRLNTSVLNEHLRELMEGLTAKVFRTYNASITLQRQLDELTDPNSSLPEKLLSYNRANRAVAILCNHQRSVPKSHGKSMANLKDKINTKREQVNDAEIELKDLKKEAKRGSVKEKLNADKKSKQLERLKEQLKKLELQETDRDENKTIALGTSKLNYLDPRISVAWCKKYDVPIEKIFNKTQRDKFRWAIDMATEDYSFIV